MQGESDLNSAESASAFFHLQTNLADSIIISNPKQMVTCKLPFNLSFFSLLFFDARPEMGNKM